MAELLHRLGTFAARRAWTVIFAWLVILGIAVGGFLIGFKGLSSSFDIPGTASGEVIAETTPPPTRREVTSAFPFSTRIVVVSAPP